MSTPPDTGDTVDRTRQADVNRLGAEVRPGWFWRGFRARFPWLADVINMARIGLGLGALLMLAACPDGNIAPDGRERAILVDVSEAPDHCAELCAGCQPTTADPAICDRLRGPEHCDCPEPTEGE